MKSEFDELDNLVERLIDLIENLGHCECETCILKDKKQCKGIVDFKGDNVCMKRYLLHYINLIEKDQEEIDRRERVYLSAEVIQNN